MAQWGSRVGDGAQIHHTADKNLVLTWSEPWEILQYRTFSPPSFLIHLTLTKLPPIMPFPSVFLFPGQPHPKKS